MQLIRCGLLGLATVALGGCFERAQPSVENAVRPVEVVQVALSDDRDSRSFSGTVRPRREADLGFRAAGRIVTREVDVGSRVIAGQVLFRLDPTDLAIALRSAEADLAASEAQAQQSSAEAARSARLRVGGWVSAAEDQLKQTAARAATERVATARAALALARNRLGYAALRAPADGVVTAILRDNGSVVAEGEPVLRVAEAGAREVEVQLPEQALPEAARPGATVTFWARPDTRVPATLRELAPAALGPLRTYTARYVLHAAPAWVALGMTATVQLPARPGAALATLPAAAVIDRGQGPMVWNVQRGGTIAAQPVRVARVEQDRLVVAGLAAGERVVAVGGQKLDPGVRVRIADVRPATE